MKRIALSLLPVVGLMGCGTLPAPVAQAPTPGVVSYQVDQTRMNLIDYVARQRGVQVVWINPPRKAVAGS